MMRGFALIAALLASAGPAMAQPGLPPEPQVREALDQHPSVLAAMARIEAARADGEALRAGPHEFQLTTSAIQRTVDREGRYAEFDASLSRPIRLPGKARLDRQAGASGIEAAENRMEDARHQAALLLADYWWDWLGAAAEQQIDAQAVQNLERSLASIRRRAELRDAAPMEVDQAEAALGATRLQVQQSAGRADLAKVRIQAQFPGLALPATPGELPLPEMPQASLAELRSLVIERSHEIGAAKAEAERLQALADRARRDRFADPSIGVRAFSERSGQETGLGLIATIPLGGRHRSALADRASNEAAAASAEAAAVGFDVQEMADTDVVNADAAWAAWQRSREGAKAQVAAVLKMRKGYDLGAIDLADLLLAERQTQDMFRAEVQARTAALRAITRILIDSHSIWISDEL
ncbi:outer membrane protein TolC [Blastomonas natatoria]|uniref:Outer membrane protein TolC n=1 Tax=Blastomonas natatoria TaxID=34015 RepID=A0A2V3UTQ3_9SPHN|nr:TolC family protein [Blastomonas natatoria]PXW71563.1 outer membrane protein TolC [Blastomonas natatoria]